MLVVDVVVADKRKPHYILLSFLMKKKKNSILVLYILRSLKKNLFRLFVVVDLEGTYMGESERE